jgi:hypothetical protein
MLGGTTRLLAILFLAVAAFVLRRAFGTGLMSLLTAELFILGLLLRTFLRSLFGHSLSLLLTMAAFVFRRSLCSRTWFRL